MYIFLWRFIDKTFYFTIFLDFEISLAVFDLGPFKSKSVFKLNWKYFTKMFKMAQLENYELNF